MAVEQIRPRVHILFAHLRHELGRFGVVDMELLSPVRRQEEAYPSEPRLRQRLDEGVVGLVEGKAERPVVHDFELRQLPLHRDERAGRRVYLLVADDVFPREARVLHGYGFAVRPSHAFSHVEGELFAAVGDVPLLDGGGDGARPVRSPPRHRSAGEAQPVPDVRIAQIRPVERAAV